MTDPSQSPQVQLFIATDKETTLVATERPRIVGRADEAASGSITKLTARPYQKFGSAPAETVESSVSVDTPRERAHALAIGAVAAVVVGLLCTWASTPWLGGPLAAAIVIATVVFTKKQEVHDRWWQERHVVLRHEDDRAVIEKAWTAAQTIADVWPHLRSLQQYPAPKGRLARRVWSIALALPERAQVRRLRDELEESYGHQPPGTSMQKDVHARLQQARARYTDIDERIQQVLSDLTDMARNCSSLQQDEHAVEQAARLTRAADELLGPGAQGRGNPDESLAERVAKVLRGCHALQAQPAGPPADPRPESDASQA